MKGGKIKDEKPEKVFAKAKEVMKEEGAVKIPAGGGGGRKKRLSDDSGSEGLTKFLKPKT